MGWMLGKVLALKEAEHRLAISAGNSVEAMDSDTEGVRKVLAAMNSTPYAACSGAELDYFRKIVFQTPFIKDGGRMRGGRVECSAISGASSLNRRRAVPGVEQAEGIKIYLDAPAFRVDGKPAIAVQSGNFYVTTESEIRPQGVPESVHLKVRLASASGALIDTAARAGQGLPRDDQAQTQELTEDALYASQCSTRYPQCVTASMAISDAMRADRARWVATIFLSSLIGCTFGLLWSFAYGRSSGMEQQLRQAIARDRLRVVYQPIVNLSTGRVAGAEALVRWTDDLGRQVSPDVFVPIAEAGGFVGEITRLVVNRVTRDLKEILSICPEFRMSVNVAPADLSDSKFLPMLNAALERTQIPRQNLAIELTETSTARREDAMQTISRLRLAGHRVYIDDFGTGYSSLSYLNELKVDAIKIDRSFTKAIGTEAVTVNILPQILAMAEALNLQVIVEGIETPEQMRYFDMASKPVYGQGWLFGRPAAYEQFVCSLVAADTSHYANEKTRAREREIALAPARAHAPWPPMFIEKTRLRSTSAKICA
jgi:sensor c-di-GMP phosphodiesterase-like protein